MIDYLGEDKESWKQYDAVDLLKSVTEYPYSEVLIDVGIDDSFLKGQQLLPDHLEAAARESGRNVTVRYQVCQLS